MDSSFESSTVLSVLQDSGIDNPPATLRDLVELSEADPRQPTVRMSIPTSRGTIPSLGEDSPDSEVVSSLVREAATFPGNQTTFVNINSGTTNRHVSISAELDAHIYNRRLLVRLYDSDYPNPESSSELKDVQWRTERYYHSFASGDDLKRLSHIRVLDHFLAGSVARRAVRSAADRALKARMETMKPEQRTDAIRAAWPEPRFQTLDDYMSHQHDLSEQIWKGTVDISQPEQPVSQNPVARIQIHANDHEQLSLPPNARLDQARHLPVQVLRDMQSRTANELVEVTKQFESLGLQDNRKRKALSEKQTSCAQQLVVINSMMSDLGVSTTEQPPLPQTAFCTELTHSAQSRPEMQSPTPVTARRVGAFPNVKWQDVRPFTPANPQVTTRPKLGNHQHVDPIVQARPSIQPHEQRPQTPFPNSQPKHHDGAAEPTTPKSNPTPGFVGPQQTSTTNLPPIQAGPTATEAGRAPPTNVMQGLVGVPYHTPPTITYLTSNQPYVPRPPAMFAPPMQPYYAPQYWQPAPLFYGPPPPTTPTAPRAMRRR